MCVERANWSVKIDLLMGVWCNESTKAFGAFRRGLTPLTPTSKLLKITILAQRLVQPR